MSGGELVLVGAMALAVYLPKALPLLLVSDRVTARLRRWLQYVAPAALGALVAPSILVPSGQLAAPSWHQASYLVALVVVLVTRRMVVALVAGMAAIVLVAILNR